ncbi:XRE family transcriptional regulator [Streptomyces sp. NPDC059002]|uniref:MmyB family transcriptional regulator n=1 Tax=Streptomyces sp. NPDC059002 TaxID=3346690 RepID=UPI0036ABCA8C
MRHILHARRQELSAADFDHSGRLPATEAAREVTCQQIDEVMGAEAGTYSAVEDGSWVPPQEYMRDLARILKLSEGEYALLHHELYSMDPPMSPVADDPALPSPAWQEVIETSNGMAYLSDRSWNVRLYNPAFAAMFPSGQPPQNTMEWTILDDEARDDILIDWESIWAPFALSRFQAALRAFPDDPGLNSTAEQILADPRARRIYEDPRTRESTPAAEDIRPMRHAVHGVGQVRLFMAQPDGAPGSLVVTMRFRPRGGTWA